MDPINESAERIMQKVRQRKLELGEADDSKENNSFTDLVTNQNSHDNKAPVSPQKNSRAPFSAPLKETNIDADLPASSITPDKKDSDRPAPMSEHKARFSALAQTFEENNTIENNHTPISCKPKEAFMKGVSPRLSLGETRASVLCVPRGQSRSPQKVKTTVAPPPPDSEPPMDTEDTRSPQKTPGDKRLRFAHPIAATSIADEYSYNQSHTVNESTIISGMIDRETTTTTTVTTTATKNIFRDSGDVSSDEYGAHTFVKKKTPTKTVSTSSLTFSPKPFVRTQSATSYSPVQFNPTTTSSPNIQNSSINIPVPFIAEINVGSNAANLNSVAARRDFIDEIEQNAKAATASSSNPTTPKSPAAKARQMYSDIDGQELSPVRSEAIMNAKAKTIAHQLEQKLKGTNVVIPTPKPIPSATTHREALHTPTQPAIQTQWRGCTSTPVVTGAEASEPAGKDVKPAANLKNLKSRWEFSSLTGTPLHPEDTEDDLIKTARKMMENERNKPTPVAATSNSRRFAPAKNEKKYGDRYAMDSPSAKSPRYMDDDDEDDETTENTQNNTSYSRYSKSPRKSPHGKSPMRREEVEEFVMEEPEDVEEESETFADNEDSQEDDENDSPDISHIIDSAFGFISRSPMKSMGGTPVPLATSESLTPDPYERAMMRKDEKPVVDNEDKTESSGRGGSSLPYTVSFYRKRMREKKIEEGLERVESDGPSAPPMQQVIGGNGHGEHDDGADIEVIKTRLEKEVIVQQERIAQGSRALRCCREQTAFRGSREEVDAQRILLVDSETLRSLKHEIERLSREGSRHCDGPRGNLSISNIQVPLSRDFVSSHSTYGSGQDQIYYFIALLKFGEHVKSSYLVSSDEAIRKKGPVEFNLIEKPLLLENLPPNFVCSLEIYAIRSRREQFTHEEKYRLTGTSGKKTLKHSRDLAMGGSAGGPSAVMDSSFLRVGQLTLDITAVSGRKMRMQDPTHPLEGSIVIKMKKHAVDRNESMHRGFLSMYQRTREGMGAWNRYWCVLNAGVMTFWKCPEDETNEKKWLVLLDLRTCASEGASMVKDICPFPNSFHIDVWVPKEKESGQSSSSVKAEVEKLRVMLAADTKNDMGIWLQVINEAARHLLMWNPIRK